MQVRTRQQSQKENYSITFSPFNFEKIIKIKRNEVKNYRQSEKYLDQTKIGADIGGSFRKGVKSILQIFLLFIGTLGIILFLTKFIGDGFTFIKIIFLTIYWYIIIEPKQSKYFLKLIFKKLSIFNQLKK